MAWLARNWIYRAFGRMGLHAHRRPKAQTCIDPVSGEPVPPGVCIAAAYEGRTYYFVSTENRTRFEAAPYRYAPLGTWPGRDMTET
jgi:YHS domain-containing protein